jgi:hypothetical protein
MELFTGFPAYIRCWIADYSELYSSVETGFMYNNLSLPFVFSRQTFYAVRIFKSSGMLRIVIW